MPISLLLLPPKTMLSKLPQLSLSSSLLSCIQCCADNWGGCCAESKTGVCQTSSGCAQSGGKVSLEGGFTPTDLSSILPPFHFPRSYPFFVDEACPTGTSCCIADGSTQAPPCLAQPEAGQPAMVEDVPFAPETGLYWPLVQPALQRLSANSAKVFILLLVALWLRHCFYVSNGACSE